MELLERDGQRARLGNALDLAASGSGRVVTVSGEAGAGKTALIERFVAEQADRARVYRGSCENLSTPEPLLPVRDIARSSNGAFVFDAAADRLAMFEAVLRLLEGGDGPALLVLEDLHWADAATLDLVRYLGRRIAQSRVLVIVTHREEELGRRSALHELLGEMPAGSVERIALGALSLAAVGRLASRVGRVGAEVHALTGGNPFLVTEVLAVEGDAISGAVRDATLARAARLPQCGRLALQAVSVFPRRVERSVAAGLLAEDGEAGLDACLDQGMLVAEGPALRFRHEIARRAVEASLAPAQRRGLHQRIVDHLRAQPQARASEMAHHAERAGDLVALLGSARRAGDEAESAGAPREAAAHFATLLRHRDRLGADAVIEALERHAVQSYLAGDPAQAHRSMREAVAQRRRAATPIPLGRALGWMTRFAWLLGRRAEAEGHAREAIEVLQSAPPSPELAWAYSYQSQLDMLADRREGALHWGERAMALAETLGEIGVRVHALNNIGTALLTRDSAPRGWQAARLSLQLAVAHGLHDHALRAWVNMSCSALWFRQYGAAESLIEDGARYAAARDLTHWEFHLRYGWRALMRIDRGDWTGAEQDALRLCAQKHVPVLFRFPGLIALARLRLRRGERDADTPLDEARALDGSLDEPQHSVYIALLDAERAWLASAPDAAADSPAVSAALARLQREHARALARDIAWVADDTALWRGVLGERPDAPPAVAGAGRSDADDGWRAAASRWRTLGCPFEEALVLCAGDEAAQRRALKIFDGLGAVPAAMRLRRQLRAAGVQTVPRGPNAPTRANAAGLTRRQMQVLGLLSDGLSNSEIARRLCISAKTAEHHVSAVLARLEAATRRQAIVAARRSGLLPEQQQEQK